VEGVRKITGVEMGKWLGKKAKQCGVRRPPQTEGTREEIKIKETGNTSEQGEGMLVKQNVRQITPGCAEKSPV